MRKQTKLVAVLSAAALLAIGASMTSFAATGWTEEDGTWVYYDKDQNKVDSTWKKSGNYWYYLDDDGYMAIDKVIEDDDNTYYVDSTGRMVTNKWVERENEDYYDGSGDDEEPETVWYYFQSSGKAYKSGDGDSVSFKLINGKRYTFDSDGQMLFGWVDDKGQRVTGDDAFREGVYYCGDSNDGARVTNDWRQLYISDNGPGQELEDQENVWFWFQANGKKFAADPSADKESERELKTKKINGKNYAFDADGIMRSKWQLATEDVATELDGYFSDIENGARKKGWFKAVPSKEINPGDYNDDAELWFYAKNDGKLVASELKTINGKKYAFNEKGEMMSGLFAIELKSSNILSYEKIGDAWEIETKEFHNRVKTVGGKRVTELDNKDVLVGTMYFGGSDDGAQKTGNQNVDVDGDTYQFSFKKDGSEKGLGTNSKDTDKILYVYGKKIKADSDYKYQVVNRETGEVEEMNDDGTDLRNIKEFSIVNTSGSIMTGNSAYKDSDGCYYQIIKKDGEKFIRYITQEIKDNKK